MSVVVRNRIGELWQVRAGLCLVVGAPEYWSDSLVKHPALCLDTGRVGHLADWDSQPLERTGALLGVAGGAFKISEAPCP